MNIHEYQAKALLKQFGLPVPPGKLISVVEDGADAASAVGGSAWVVKAQILAGGRGKGRFKEIDAGTQGGIRFAKSIEEIRAGAKAMLGRTLITRETGSRGNKVNCVYVEQRVEVAREFFISLQVDSNRGGVTAIVSTGGGVNFGAPGRHAGEKTMTFSIHPATGLMRYHWGLVATTLGLTFSLADQAASLIANLYEAFVATDMMMLEINPLVETTRGALQCLDAKIAFDPSALFRQADIRRLLEATGAAEDAAEAEARKQGLAYIPFEGTIGCIVNGAGLAMATSDLIKLYGEEPANFLDLGSGASEEKITAAFRLILMDAEIEGILVNIFSGIMKCDVIARGVIAAARAVGLTVPLVVRLEGTNADLARDYIGRSAMDVIMAEDLDDAARKIVDVVRKSRAARIYPGHLGECDLLDKLILKKAGSL